MTPDGVPSARKKPRREAEARKRRIERKTSRPIPSEAVTQECSVTLSAPLSAGLLSYTHFLHGAWNP